MSDPIDVLGNMVKTLRERLEKERDKTYGLRIENESLRVEAGRWKNEADRLRSLRGHQYVTELRHENERLRAQLDECREGSAIRTRIEKIHLEKIATLRAEMKADARFMQGVHAHLVHDDIDAALEMYEERCLRLAKEKNDE